MHGFTVVMRDLQKRESLFVPHCKALLLMARVLCGFAEAMEEKTHRELRLLLALLTLSQILWEVYDQSVESGAGEHNPASSHS